MTDIVVDACRLINLVAAGSILPTPSDKNGQSSVTRFPSTLHVPKVVVNESLYILQLDSDDPTSLIKTPIDLSTAWEQRTLCECDVEGDEESSLYVQLAVRLDDGEAAALAIAKNRSWALATDDRVAASTLTFPELTERCATQGALAAEKVFVKVIGLTVGGTAAGAYITGTVMTTSSRFSPLRRSIRVVVPNKRRRRFGPSQGL